MKSYSSTACRQEQQYGKYHAKELWQEQWHVNGIVFAEERFMALQPMNKISNVINPEHYQEKSTHTTVTLKIGNYCHTLDLISKQGESILARTEAGHVLIAKELLLAK